MNGLTSKQVDLIRTHGTVAGYSSYVETEPGDEWSPDGYGYIYLLEHTVERVHSEVGVNARWSDVEDLWLAYFREGLVEAHNDAQNCHAD